MARWKKRFGNEKPFASLCVLCDTDRRMRLDPRFLREEGCEIYTGNELLIKGLLETDGGTHLWTGYPGSPIAGFFDAIEQIAPLLKEKGIRAALANNEALAAAMLNGSQMSGLRGVAAMKSVGLHVAADALALGNLAGAHPDGGAVVIVGDDPWSDSTQVPADSRYLCKHLFMPVVEPADFQELKDWLNISFQLSNRARLYIGYLVTTNQADGGGTVWARTNHWPKINANNRIELDTAKIDLDDRVLLPPRTWWKEDAFTQRFADLWTAARELGVNRIEFSKATGRDASATKKAPLGFVATGLAYVYLTHALAELGVLGDIPILKLGVSYPADPQLVEEFATTVEKIIVVEERRGFLEEQIASIATKARQNGRQVAEVWGKQFPDGEGFPSIRGLHPSIVLERIAPVLHDAGFGNGSVERELATIAATEKFDATLAPRTPTFCPGCPHRDSASVLMQVKADFRNAEYMFKVHNCGPVDLVFHGDTGCYTMLMFEPTKELMHNYSGMGLGGGTGAGIDPFIRNKQVVFLGDSTFFHSGTVAISNSLKNKQDITYIILDNKTTAMTGHQTTPGLEPDLMGESTYAQNIDRIVGALLPEGAQVIRANPGYRQQWREMLEETILQEGVKVIVADKECAITFHRRRASDERSTIRERGYLPEKKFVNVTPDVCEFCLECTLQTGCPGLTFVNTRHGPKVQTDLSWCVADTACAKIKACPSFEEVTVYRDRPTPPRWSEINPATLPIPSILPLSSAWRAYLAGVGGMGIGVATAVLVRAGFKEGYRVQFCDKKGLAIRNGGVYSQIVFAKPGLTTSQIIPYGKADLLLGVDLLEAARGLDPRISQRVASSRSVAIVNTHKTPTILTLLGKDDFCVNDLENALRRATNGEKFFGRDVSALSEQLFGAKLYANIIMLGVAFQRGLLPASLDSIEWAIRETTGKAATENLAAFHWGRKLVADPRATPQPADGREITFESVVEEKSRLLAMPKFNWLPEWVPQQHNTKLAEEYRQIVGRAVEEMRRDARPRMSDTADLSLSDDTLRDLAVRVYDLIQFENLAYAEKYLAVVKQVHAKDRAEFDFAATKAVIWNLHKAMAIKDEVYVASLLTAPDKLARDRQRYDVDAARGDRIEYSHFTRPHFSIFGQEIEFDIRTQNWMLEIMKHGKFLRRWLPDWHQHEKDFRDWYRGVIENFHYHDRASYDLYVRALRCVEPVRGYREVRYPKMAEARKKVEALLAKMDDRRIEESVM